MTDLSLTAVKQQIGATTSEPPDRFIDPLNRARAEQTELRGREQFLKLRGAWSGWLIVWITFLLIFQIALAICVGRGLLDFQKYQWFLPLVVAQNFGQVVGMGVVIVRFLYPSSK